MPIVLNEQIIYYWSNIEMSSYLLYDISTCDILPIFYGGIS